MSLRSYVWLACGLVVAAMRTPVAWSYPLTLDEDQLCTSSSGAPGVCKRLNDCPSAVNEVRSRSRPVRCGFVGFEEVVCCTTGERNRTPPRRVPDGVRSEGRLRKSEQACLNLRKNEMRRIGFFILGGEEAKEGEFPHMAALGYRPPGERSWSWRCGGTLISDQYVLTAAHCVTDRNVGQPKVVRLGEVDVGSKLPGQADYTVEKVTWHPQYKKKFSYDDVALIKLSSRVRFSQNVSPACLFSRRQDPSSDLTATGWGATDGAGTTVSIRLLKTNLTSVPIDTCRNSYKVFGKIPEGLRADMMCAGDPQGVSDTCVGDSGGPLQVLEDRSSSVYSVVGVTSFGPNPCGGKKPSVYARVSSYLDWIEDIVWP